MTAYSTKEADSFFVVSGRTLPDSKPVEFEAQLPNVLGGKPLPGRGKLLVKSVDRQGGRAVVEVAVKLDPKRMAEIAEQLAMDMASKMGFPVPEGFSIKDVDIQMMTEVDVDLASGWPNAVTSKVVFKVEGMSREDTTTMKRLPDEKPPAQKESVKTESPGRS